MDDELRDMQQIQSEAIREDGQDVLVQIEADDDVHTPDGRDALPGIWRELGDLPPGAIVTEKALARMLGRHQVSIKRAVQRGELPAPTRLLGGPVWTAGVLLQHIEARLGAAQEEAERTRKRISELSP